MSISGLMPSEMTHRLLIMSCITNQYYPWCVTLGMIKGLVIGVIYQHSL